MAKEKLTLQTAILTVIAATPFTALWLVVLNSYGGILLGFGLKGGCPDIITLQWFILAILVHELILFVPRWFTIHLTNVREIPVWIVAHIPVVLAIAWLVYFLFDLFAARCI